MGHSWSLLVCLSSVLKLVSDLDEDNVHKDFKQLALGNAMVSCRCCIGSVCFAIALHCQIFCSSNPICFTNKLAYA